MLTLTYCIRRILTHWTWFWRQISPSPSSFYENTENVVKIFRMWPLFNRILENQNLFLNVFYFMIMLLFAMNFGIRIRQSWSFIFQLSKNSKIFCKKEIFYTEKKFQVNIFETDFTSFLHFSKNRRVMEQFWYQIHV